jgi:hypothetical protein
MIFGESDDIREDKSRFRLGGEAAFDFLCVGFKIRQLHCDTRSAKSGIHFGWYILGPALMQPLYVLRVTSVITRSAATLSAD